MKLSAFKQHLLNHPQQPVGFVFDDGDFIPGHFHVTEVGHVAKNFIDCGGTVRSISSVQLQVWLGSDEHHRLTAGKLVLHGNGFAAALGLTGLIAVAAVPVALRLRR